MRIRLAESDASWNAAARTASSSSVQSPASDSWCGLTPASRSASNASAFSLVTAACFVHAWPLTTYHLPPTTYYLLLTTYYSLLTTCYLLLATHYLLLATDLQRPRAA